MNPGQRRGRPEQTVEQQKRSNNGAKLKAELLERIKAQRSEFESWVMRTELQKKQKRMYIRAIRRITTMEELDEALHGSKNTRLALRKFILFLRDEGYIDDLMYEKYKRLIRLPRTSIDTRFYSDDDIMKILNDVRAQKSEKYYLFLRLVIESGLRKRHAIEAYNKIVSGEGQEVGEGVYEVLLDIHNNTKQAFVCLCSTETAKQIHELGEKISEAGAHKLNKRGILFNAIRKWWANVAIEVGMNPDIIDFVQGRVARSIWAQHYINKLGLARKEYPEVLWGIKRRVY